MVERLCQARRTWGPHPRSGGAAERGAGIVVGPEPWVKGGRSPAQRTLDARGRAITLAHGRMRRGCASGHESQSGARRGTQAAIDHGFERQDQVVPPALECGEKRLRGAEHFLAMMDRSDQARQNAGPRISIKGLEGSARTASLFGSLRASRVGAPSAPALAVRGSL